MSGVNRRLHPGDLVAAGRSLPSEFTSTLRLDLHDPAAPGETPAAVESTVHFRSIFRLLPGRRLTALVEVDGRPMVAKLFFGADAARYCEREVRGRALLAAAGVATPALLGRVAAADDAVRGLLIAYLADARPLAADDASGWRQAAAQLARLHQAGVVHRDPHANNFLVGGSDGRIHLIDGDGVHPVLGRRPLGRRASLRNLARLCAERPPLADAGVAEMFGAYAAVRGWSPAASGPLDRATRVERRRRERRYLEKAQRDCTEFACEHGFRRYLIRLRTAMDPALDALLADPERAMRAGEVVKAGNSATVVRVHLGNRTCIVKRYNQKSLWHALRRVIRPTARFRRAWLNGQRLHLLDIPTARPLALLERRFGPLRGVAYLVMEDLGADDLGALAAAGDVSDATVDGVVRLFQALRAAGLRHGDTKATNFIVAADRVALVDLDAMRTARIRAAPDTATRDQDLQRFLANFRADPALRKRFDAAFAAAGLLPAPVGAGGVAAPPRRL